MPTASLLMFNSLPADLVVVVLVSLVALALLGHKLSQPVRR